MDQEEEFQQNIYTVDLGKNTGNCAVLQNVTFVALVRFKGADSCSTLNIILYSSNVSYYLDIGDKGHIYWWPYSEQKQFHLYTPLCCIWYFQGGFKLHNEAKSQNFDNFMNELKLF